MKKNILVDELRIVVVWMQDLMEDLYILYGKHIGGKDRWIKVFWDVWDFGSWKTLNRMLTKWF